MLKKLMSIIIAGAIVAVASGYAFAACSMKADAAKQAECCAGCCCCKAGH